MVEVFKDNALFCNRVIPPSLNPSRRFKTMQKMTNLKYFVGMRGLPPLRSVLSLVPRSGRTGSHPLIVFSTKVFVVFED